MTLYADLIPTPLPELAALCVKVDADGALVELDFLPATAHAAHAAKIAAIESAAARREIDRAASGRGDRLVWDGARCAAVADQLRAYFARERKEFDLPLAPRGTEFQRRVWEELSRIPYGTTVSYAELAARIGRPGAFRAVGRANGTNPIPVILPCHRVIGADGSLTGYGGGMELKRALLALEGVLLA
jgi:methylated-DNA-[protein]-cysteine S-methyltransferase